MSGTNDPSPVKVPPRKVEPFKNNVPSNWVINEGPKGVVAFNNVSGEKFEGTMNEFNNRLRA
jgi:hypothetical protein